MPDRPKRRKNNKNKRKNKNNRSDLNKNNSDVNELDNSESISIQNDSLNAAQSSALDETVYLVNEPQQSKPENISPEIEVIPDRICVDIQSVNQDLNNNSNTLNVQTLDVPVLNTCNLEYEDIEIQESQTYIVESPEQSIKSKQKLSTVVKSKSLDNDDDPKIIEVTEDASVHSEDENSLAFVDSTNILVSEVESDVEWEKTNELDDVQIPQLKEVASGTFSITTFPLNVAQCEDPKSLTTEEETSLRNYLKTLNLATHPENINSIEIKAEIEQIINREIRQRLRKKGLADDFVTQRLGPPRTLDVIDEEGSSESSMTSRRQSYLSDKKSDEDLEDDVFEDKSKSKDKFSTKAINTRHKTSFGRLVPQQCLLVGAKIKEPEISEARGDWTMKTIEKMTGAEVVYLTDSSSSTSSLHDFGEEGDDSIDTDVSVRMITPTIEVSDTESLLKKTYVSNNANDSQDKHIQNFENYKKENVEHTLNIEFKNDSDDQTENSITQTSHEIVVLSTDNIKTDLYVKELNEPESNKKNKNMMESNTSSITLEAIVDRNTGSGPVTLPKNNVEYDLEIKVLKCELNDAINNLIKEVVSDSETPNDPKDPFTRQDSSSSVSSSQCTAKYNPTYSSLNDVSNIMHDETCESNKSIAENIETSSVMSHVKDVFECVTGNSIKINFGFGASTKQPISLRDLCVQKIVSLPYGDKMLEELASVSKRLQNITAQKSNSNSLANIHIKKDIIGNIDYLPLSDMSSIAKVACPTKLKVSIPPPVLPRNSSLKITHDEEHRTVPSKIEADFICLSPSQKKIVEKTHTVLSKEDTNQDLKMHKNFLNRKGYSEYSSKEKEKNSVDISQMVPFKSRTGSRLLALIRDPTVTGNVKSLGKLQYNSLDQLQKKLTTTGTNSMKNSEMFNNDSNTFKPIPPPRPKKMSSYYESDESSDYTDNSLRTLKSEKKVFHFSTGNLNKEIENDISSIQNMHRFYTNKRDQLTDYTCPRRPSLPKDLCDQQMEYIRQKEKEVEAEIQRLETVKNNTPSLQKQGPRAPLISEKAMIDERIKDSNNYYVSRKRDIVINSHWPENQEKYEKEKISSLFTSSQEEMLRDKMYSEYVNQMAERQERKQHKVIKITHSPATTSNKLISKSMSALDVLDLKVNNRIEKEFISKARERWNKLGIKDPETEDEIETGKFVYREPKVIKHKIKVIESGEETDVKKLPNHLQEFVCFAAKDKEQASESSGESETGPASPHVMIWCAVIIIVLAVSKYFLRLIRNK